MGDRDGEGTGAGEGTEDGLSSQVLAVQVPEPVFPQEAALTGQPPHHIMAGSTCERELGLSGPETSGAFSTLQCEQDVAGC